MTLSYTFEVVAYDIATIDSTSLPDTRENIIFGLQNRTVWIETIGSAKKYGDQFTVSGQQAVYLKELYADIDQPLLKIVENTSCGEGEVYIDGSCVRALPTVTTLDLSMGFAANATATGVIDDGGASAITEYGFVWATNNPPTLDDNVISVGTDDFVGEFENTFYGLDPFTTIYVAAFATNSYGTTYGEVLDGEPQICLAAGTVISLANGETKNIEDITYQDDLLVWNFDERKYDSSKPVWILKPFKASRYGSVKFSNVSELKTVADGRGHRIFNANKNMFTFSMNEDTPLETKTFSLQKDYVNVVSKEIIKEDTVFYNVITNMHFNVFANGILTSTGLNNLYPIHDMKFIKNEQSTYEDIEGIPSEIVNGLRLLDQPKDYPNLKEKIDVMMSRMMEK